MSALLKSENIDLDTVLSAHGFGVAFGKKIILTGLDFTLSATGVTALMGPVGTGKSTLLRALAWQDNHNPNFRCWGRVELRDQLLGEHCHAALVAQKIRMFQVRIHDFLADEVRRTSAEPLSSRQLRETTESLLAQWQAGDIALHLDDHAVNLPRPMQLRLAIIAAMVGAPPLLVIDEPTAGLGEEDAASVLALISKIGQRIPVLLSLHNQAQARAVATDIMMIAGGRIQACCPTHEFFNNPKSDVVRHFIKSGSCHLPSPDADPGSLADDVAPPPPLPLVAQVASSAPPEYRGPYGFHWIVPGKLGTTPLPGAVTDISHDLAALRVVGVTTLITLTNGDLPQDTLASHGLRNIHLPIYDREAPTIAQLRMLVINMNKMFARGEVLAVHCRAGIGRTGTVIAGWLIAEGLTTDAALERIRKIDKHYVQTAQQEAFLHAYEAYLLAKA